MIADPQTERTPRAIPRSVEVTFPRRLLVGFIAGGVLAAGFPPYGLPLLLPLGVAALLFALDRATVREGAYTGLACGALYFGATLLWLGNLFGAAAISLIAIAAAFIALFGGLYAWLRSRIPRIPIWILAPILWTSIEFYRSEFFTLNFGWIGLGYGVVNSPWLAMAASWAGSYGVTMLIVLVGVLLLNRRAQIPVVVLWILLIFVPSSSPYPENRLRIRLVQAFSDDQDELFRRSLPGTDRVDVILWPEYSLTSDPSRDPGLWSRLQSVARANRCYFIFGAKDESKAPSSGGSDLVSKAPSARGRGLGEGEFRNTAFVLAPDGRHIGSHVKNHTVHFIKDGIRGTEAVPTQTGLGKLGVAICFDMDYPDVARRLAESGAEVFLVPNMDPEEWGPVQRDQHRLMFQMRAAECGKWLARADVSGGTSVAAPNGQEAARVNTSDPTTLAAVVGRNPNLSFYVRYGWILPRICLFITVALLALSFAPSKRRLNHIA